MEELGEGRTRAGGAAGVAGEGREWDDWSEKAAGGVRFMGEKLESEDPLGVGED